MMPTPRLTLVSNSDEPDTDLAAAEARELARALDEADATVDADAAAGHAEKLRILEAVLFASTEPLDVDALAQHLPQGEDVRALLTELQQAYAGRGVNLVRVAGRWSFRTAADLSYLLERYAKEERRLSKAALETLAIVAYHQPVTRAEIEDIRGVSISAGTLDILMEAGWIRPRGRRRAPGKPITYGTTENFLTHFGLDTVKDLPGLADLKAAGLLDQTLPPGFMVPDPSLAAGLMPDELPLEAADEETDELSGAEDADTDVDEEVAADLPDEAEAPKSKGDEPSQD